MNLEIEHSSIRVVLLDDSPTVLRTIPLSLERDGDIRVICASASCDIVLAAVEDHAPEVALVDLHLEGRAHGPSKGIDAISRICRASASVRVAAFTGFPTPRNFVAAIKAGATSFVPKELRRDIPLQEIVRCIARDKSWFDNDLIVQLALSLDEASMAESFESTPLVGASSIPTQAELEALWHFGQNHTYNEISTILNKSEDTIKAQLSSARKRLKATASREAFEIAKARGLFDKREWTPRPL